MSTCPPGYVFNPESYRCVKQTGRIGRRLEKEPVVAPVFTARLPKSRFHTRRNPLNVLNGLRTRTKSRRIELPLFNNVMHNMNAIPEMLTRVIRLSRDELVPRLRNTDKGSRNGCEVGKIRNPKTGKCIKEGGRTQKRLLKNHTPQTRRNPNYSVLTPQHRTRTRSMNRLVNREREPLLQHRHVYHESRHEPRHEPIQPRAAKIPSASREVMREWIRTNCSNEEEPFTGRRLTSLQEDEMASLIRTSAGTCLRPDYLDAHVRKQRSLGRDATDPLTKTPLTLSNMDILGRAIRRVIPDYRVPQRSRKEMVPRLTRGSPEVIELRRSRNNLPPHPRPQLPLPQQSHGFPEHLKFFIGKDARSGDDFYSIYYYDKRQVSSAANGLSIPASAIKIDIGLIPSYVSLTESRNPLCTTAAIMDTILSLNRKNRLVRKLGDQWTAAIELPTERAQWKTPDGAIQKRFFQQVCEYLRALNR